MSARVTWEDGAQRVRNEIADMTSFLRYEGCLWTGEMV
jgi:hypothetical protein